ncbi:hypothetical protein LX99_04204 [Mucilaginibacter oryzae]|uniref:Uncharacterized protein n=1 Tax=Mucilaginibacter oryzae TaxID=468058 RepID=A0A316H8Q3_9SPHI|nr:hypothetical protein [Mucilaginibacter oryzae]PWK73818.1 hypothetical protein LX99_04204 [Mucilaginibacter oryzae]
MERKLIAAYWEGILSINFTIPSVVIDDIKKSGINHVILAQFHIYRNDGNDVINSNDNEIISNGFYSKNTPLNDYVENLMTGSEIVSISASVSNSYEYVKKVYINNNNSFSGTNLENNFLVFKQNVPGITIIDIDDEGTYDQTSLVAFCQMLISIGYDITFCPYKNKEFWTACLDDLNKSNPGAVKRWNLQCYDGGTGNDPKVWASQIKSTIPDFNTDGFIAPGDWTTDGVNNIQATMNNFALEKCVGGGFLWRVDDTYKRNCAENPDNHNLKDFISAIKAGLSFSFMIQANQPWQDSGISITPPNTVTIAYQSGLWTADLKTNNGNLYDANGCPDQVINQSGYPLPGHNQGCLIGKIGTNPPFFIGNGPTSTPSGKSGELYLCIDDDLNGAYGSGLSDNKGSILVMISQA